MAEAIVGITVATIVTLIAYVYMAVCLMLIAQKTDTRYPWLAWIPIANVFLMCMVAKKPWWWALVMVVAYSIVAGFYYGNIGWLASLFYIVGLVFTIIVWIAICQARSRPGWWVILILIPLVNIVIIGVLAFSKK